MAVTAAALPLSGGRGVPAALCRGVHVLYEVLLQSSLLVTCVVTFILMPARIRHHRGWLLTTYLLSQCTHLHSRTSVASGRGP